jgi:hypothetical protein
VRSDLLELSIGFQIYNDLWQLHKSHPRTYLEGPEGEERYSSNLSLISALYGGVWSTPRSVRFTPGKDTQYPLNRSLGGSQGRSGRARKISPPPGFDPWIVQRVVSRCTDWAILAHPLISVTAITLHSSFSRTNFLTLSYTFILQHNASASTNKHNSSPLIKNCALPNDFIEYECCRLRKLVFGSKWPVVVPIVTTACLGDRILSRSGSDWWNFKEVKEYENCRKS